MPGSTNALGRPEEVVHGNCIIVKGDETTYHSMTNLRKIMSTKYDWLLSAQGFYFKPLHSAKTLLQRYYLAGIPAT